jgi:hypothetical protein
MMRIRMRITLGEIESYIPLPMRNEVIAKATPSSLDVIREPPSSWRIITASRVTLDVNTPVQRIYDGHAEKSAQNNIQGIC